MRINPAGNSVPPQYQRVDPKASPSQGEAKASPQASSTSIQFDSIRDLSQVLEQSAEVRESVVEAVKLKLQTGEYLTREAAVETARSILDL
jgi:anti-sigma28 factor (negative regulator of flagellin synthesis)